jgi:hypothetical protein
MQRLYMRAPIIIDFPDADPICLLGEGGGIVAHITECKRIFGCEVGVEFWFIKHKNQKGYNDLVRTRCFGNSNFIGNRLLMVIKKLTAQNPEH